MKFAVVEGERQEAQPRLAGKCPVCGDAMIARCGNIRVPHWAHLRTRTCDPWKEPETEWHRAWKNKFPREWQEFIQWSEAGEKHIADVKTESGVVLEFQHSHLHQDERKARENFYPKMVWVVDGTRLKRDRAQFFASVDVATVINRKPGILSVQSNDGALLRDWGASRVPVYFDFGDDKLWRLNPCIQNGMTYLSRVPKTVFLNAHLRGQPFEEMVSKAVERAAARYSEQLRAVYAVLSQPQQAARLQPPRSFGFQRWLARRERKRFRF